MPNGASHLSVRDRQRSIGLRKTKQDSDTLRYAAIWEEGDEDEDGIASEVDSIDEYIIQPITITHGPSTPTPSYTPRSNTPSDHLSPTRYGYSTPRKRVDRYIELDDDSDLDAPPSLLFSPGSAASDIIHTPSSSRLHWTTSSTPSPRTSSLDAASHRYNANTPLRFTRHSFTPSPHLGGEKPLIPWYDPSDDELRIRITPLKQACETDQVQKNPWNLDVPPWKAEWPGYDKTEKPFLSRLLDAPIPPHTKGYKAVQPDDSASTPQGRWAESTLYWSTPLSRQGGMLRLCKRLVFAQRHGPIRGIAVNLNVTKKSVTQDIVEDGESLFAALVHDMDPAVMANVVAHAVHTTNLSSSDGLIRGKSRLSLLYEMRKASRMGVSTLVFHLGSSPDEPVADVFKRVAPMLHDLLQEVPEVTLAIENMTHRCRGETSCSLEALEGLIEMVDVPGRLKICLDICHIYVAQYDLATDTGLRHFLAMIERLGSGRIAAVHLSDSYEVHGGKADRHANIGFGMIPLSAMCAILRHPVIASLPLILETPAYFPRNHNKGYGLPREIGILEDKRHRGERAFLDRLAALPDGPNLEGEFSRVLQDWKQEKVGIEKAIYRLGKGDQGVLRLKLEECRRDRRKWQQRASVLKRRRSREAVNCHGTTRKVSDEGQPYQGVQ